MYNNWTMNGLGCYIMLKIQESQFKTCIIYIQNSVRASLLTDN